MMNFTKGIFEIKQGNDQRPLFNSGFVDNNNNNFFETSY